MPLDGSQLLLYVRTELLAASGAAGGSGGLRVPDSWEQLLAEAAAVNGSLAAQLRPVVNATGGVSYAAATAPVFGFCMQPHTHMLGALALAVLAPLVQTNGSDQVGMAGGSTGHGNGSPRHVARWRKDRERGPCGGIKSQDRVLKCGPAMSARVSCGLTS